jgi:hypothetical protein
MKNMENTFVLISSTEPEVMREYIITEIGERSKDKLYNFLKDLEKSYPDFDNWFYKTVAPEVKKRTGEREIIIVLSHFGKCVKQILTGIAILKKTPYEKKICAFRVHENYRFQGIGSELFEKCFEFLETRTPVITISSDRMSMFKHHIDKYNFVEKEILKDYYVKGSTEYVYNGILSDKK